MDNYDGSLSSILNGRINLFDNNATTSKVKNNDSRFYNENNISTINRLYSGTCVSELFFSKDNIDIIQEGIIKSVYLKSNGSFRIGKQSEKELTIIMRSIYFQNSKNLNFDITTQVRELNKLVIDWSVDEIIKNVKQYIGYKKSVSTLPMPLEHSVLPSQKGTNILEIKSFI